MCGNVNRIWSLSITFKFRGEFERVCKISKECRMMSERALRACMVVVESAVKSRDIFCPAHCPVFLATFLFK